MIRTLTILGVLAAAVAFAAWPPAPPERALECPDPAQVATLELQSVTVDGVEQTDLSAYDGLDWFVSPFAFDSGHLSLTVRQSEDDLVILWETYERQ